jgi:hypothetical protein
LNFAVTWPAAEVNRPHIIVELLHFAARSQRKQVNFPTMSSFRAGMLTVGESNMRSSLPRIKGGVVKFGERANFDHGRREKPLPAQKITKAVRGSRFELQYAFCTVGRSSPHGASRWWAVDVETKNAYDYGPGRL